MEYQHTLGDALAFEGVGLHTGAAARVRIVPQPAESGVRFSLGGAEPFAATSEFVVETRRATVLGDGGATVSTVEHVLSALFAMGVDNALIEVDGPELPILDGSASIYTDAIVASGLVEQAAPRALFTLDRPAVFEDGDAVLIVSPADAFRLRFAVDFEAPVGAQYLDLTLDAATFRSEIAAARTFGYLHEVEALRAAGLARGGSLDNALVFAPEGPLSPLRWPNEVVRHKALDLIGDFALLGAWPKFDVVAIKSGHRLHAQAVAGLRARRAVATALS
ncbi:MAG: UDP-3-O-[3-hydroxymyristoyl] N-acetylglucosamine deacetylase [Candidatus Eremiobacteraeota bacterium]|nr:UDP-3-O-[3-hydroxymyristoyl] N-acetylglucosamine deacetylase [Candidatus Eremiobacteraeota bacterium]